MLRLAPREAVKSKKTKKKKKKSKSDLCKQVNKK